MALADTEGFTDLAMGPANGQPASHGLYAEFYMNPVQNQPKSAEENRPIFDEVAFVRIMVPGNKTSVIERPVRLGPAPVHDNNRFAQEYRMFEQGLQDVVVGTPLSEWPRISRSQVLEMEYFHVKTVEQLAEMTDANAQNFAGVLNLREQAKAYLAEAKDGKQLSQIQNELSKRDEEMAALQTQMAELVAELGDKKKGKRT